MRAYRLLEVGTPPAVIDHPEPKLQAGHAIVALHASAFNRRDHWISLGKYPALQAATLGSDGCGMVVDGPPKWRDKSVVICPSINWGTDERYQQREYTILGMPTDGTFAEYISVPVEIIHEKPAHLNALQGAAFPLAGLTAWRALFTRARCQPGEKVLITGIGGGVALFAMQFALAQGASVYVTSGSPSKLQRALEMGANGGALYTDPDWHKQLGKNFDVIIDSAGGEGFGKLVRLLGMGGRLAFYGGTLGKWPSILPQHLFFKQVSILASTMGSPTEFGHMCRFIAKHQIIPVIDREFPLEKAPEAMQRIVHPDRFGKVALRVL